MINSDSGPVGPPADSVDVVLFDLGGVLVHVPGVQAMLDLTGMTSEPELWARWLACPWVRRFESGRCSDVAFAEGLVGEWELDLSPSAFLDGFAGWPTGPMHGAEDLVSRTRAKVPVGCLSNTNSLHWEVGFSNWSLMDLFDHRFLSFEMGLLKPDVEAFDHVSKALGVEPGRIVFLDDNALNVEGARAAGMVAARTSGVDEARCFLKGCGLISTR